MCRFELLGMRIRKVGVRPKRWFWRTFGNLTKQFSTPAARALRKYAPSVRESLQPTLSGLYVWLEHRQGFSVVPPTTEPSGSKPRLLIDVSTTFHVAQVTGIQRTVRSLVAALKRNGHRYHLDPIPVRLKPMGGTNL